MSDTATFSHDGFDIAFTDWPPADTGGEGGGEPVLMIHGFASSRHVNWVAPGWVKTLTEAGYRAIAFDHRGHGLTTKSYEEADYTPSSMAGDAAALLDHLGIEKAHILGYSMGARVAAFMALEHPARVATLIFGGLGIGMIDGVGDWDPIAEALRAPDAATVTHPRGRMFRSFADKTRSDREALAACIARSRENISAEEIARIAQPTLVAVGTEDEVGGEPQPLADMMPNAEAFAIQGRDHMLAVGDRTFKARALAFLAENPISDR